MEWVWFILGFVVLIGASIAYVDLAVYIVSGKHLVEKDDFE